MSDALIGHSGFVGGNLARQHEFDETYRSHDIENIVGQSFDVLVCAGAPGAKWLANRDPVADRASIDRLQHALKRVDCGHFVLISTVDVFHEPVGVDENSRVESRHLAPYGLHRYELEQFIARRFPRRLIVRLPGLVGPDLRKNAVFDLHHAHEVEKLDGRAVLQFYPVTRLWSDIGVALEAGIELLHLTAAPLPLADIAREAFGRELKGMREAAAVQYDFRSAYAGIFGGTRYYQCSREESLAAIRDYARTEPARA